MNVRHFVALVHPYVTKKNPRWGAGKIGEGAAEIRGIFEDALPCVSSQGTPKHSRLLVPERYYGRFYGDVNSELSSLSDSSRLTWYLYTFTPIFLHSL